MAEETGSDGFKEKDGSKEHKGNPLIIILFAVNALVMGAVAFLQFSHQKKLEAEPPIKEMIKKELESLDAAHGGGEEGAKGGGGHGEAKAGGHGAGGPSKEEEGILFPMEDFTANLAQGEGPRRFVRMKIVLKFSRSSNEEEFKGRKPQMSDTIITLLNSKRPEDLLKPEGKQYLKEEIKTSINSFLINGSIIDVYYVNFQIN